jgi:hypothetical protein
VFPSFRLIRSAHSAGMKAAAQSALLSELLLDDGWRERVVERFVFGAGSHIRASTAFQFALDRKLVESVHRPLPKKVNLLLPVTRREKRPLLNFDLRGPDGQDAYLLPRDQIGHLHARYLLDAFARVGLGALLAPDIFELLRGVCTFTPAFFQSFLPDAPARFPSFPPFLRDAQGDRDRALASYLTQGLPAFGTEHPVTQDDVGQWREQTDRTREHLVEALGEQADDMSSSEQPLLALPEMIKPPTDRTGISSLLTRYHDIVEALVDSEATEELRDLADSGRRWILIAELVVPIGTRFSVTLGEDRPLDLRRRQPRSTFAGQPSTPPNQPRAPTARQRSALTTRQRLTLRSRQRFALKDALRAHLEVRTADPNIQLSKPVCRDPLGTRIGFGPIEELRWTDETISLYSSVKTRPRFLDVDIYLRPERDLRALPMLVATLGLAALIVALILPANPNLFVGLAILAVPITVAAGLLAVREQSALATSLQASRRAVVVAVTILLWAAVIVRLLSDDVELPPCRQPPKPVNHHIHKRYHCHRGAKRHVKRHNWHTWREPQRPGNG